MPEYLRLLEAYHYAKTPEQKASSLRRLIELRHKVRPDYGKTERK